MVISFFYCWMHMLLQYYIIHVIVNAVLRLEMCLRQGLFLQSARFCWSFWSWVPDNQSLTFFSSGLWHFTICRCWNNIWVWWIRDCLTVIVSFHSVCCIIDYSCQISTSKDIWCNGCICFFACCFLFFFRFFFCKLSVHSVRVSWNRFQLIFVCGLGNIWI